MFGCSRRRYGKESINFNTMPTRNKKIGIDLDETIVHSFEPMIRHINKKYGSALELDHLIHHDWWTISGFPIDMATIVHEWEILSIMDPSENNFLPVSESKEVLLSLKEAGYELHIITARNEVTRKKSTQTWIDRNFPGIFSWIHYSSHYSDGDRRDKSEICKLLDIKVVVDDNLDFALEMAEKGIEVYVLDRPWNRHRTEFHNSITRVQDWKKIEQNLLNNHITHYQWKSL